MNYVAMPSAAISPTAQAATGPSRATFTVVSGESVSGAVVNRVVIPNALTRQVMAETEAGVNVVNCSSLDELFDQLDS